MDEIKQIDGRIREMERNIQKLKDTKYQLSREKERRRVKDLEEQIDVKVYRSSDYAGLTTAKYYFYYGYEHTMCPVHGNDSSCRCDEGEWAFVVSTVEGDVELLRIPRSKLTLDVDGILAKLLCGVGQFLNQMEER